MDEQVIPGVPSAESNPLCVTSTDDNGMTLAVLRVGENVTVVIEGEIDLLTVSQMSEALSSEMAKSPVRRASTSASSPAAGPRCGRWRSPG